jgi:serine O-acetyltransferase
MLGRRDQAWQADFARVSGRRAFLKEQSLWAIWVYRFGRRLDQHPDGIGKKFLFAIYWLLSHTIETVTGISLPRSCMIGKGLRIWHFGGVFIHHRAVIGENCTLRQGVTIGNRYNDEVAPRLGDNVELGAYAQVLGGVHIGNGCKIGAMTVVITDMPDGSTAVGPPARIILRGTTMPSGVSAEHQGDL